MRMRPSMLPMETASFVWQPYTKVEPLDLPSRITAVACPRNSSKIRCSNRSRQRKRRGWVSVFFIASSSLKLTMEGSKSTAPKGRGPNSAFFCPLPDQFRKMDKPRILIIDDDDEVRTQ